MKSDDSDGFFNPHDPDDLVHHYTTEEIDEYRWISIDRNGIETIATDREVVTILEKVRRNNFSTSFSEPHFPENHPPEKMMNKRTVFGKDGRYIHSSVGNPYCAIGQMENGCTAFLVGPYHAITSRHCVYDCSKREFLPYRGIYLQRNCFSRGIFMDDYEPGHMLTVVLVIPIVILRIFCSTILTIIQLAGWVMVIVTQCLLCQENYAAIPEKNAHGTTSACTVADVETSGRGRVVD